MSGRSSSSDPQSEDPEATPNEAAGAAGIEPAPAESQDAMEGTLGPETDAVKGGEVRDDAAAGSMAAAPDADAAAEFKDRWLRAEADLQNFRRRSHKEREEARRTSEESVLLEMIVALDDLERALQTARAAGADEAWLQGVDLVAARMRDSLARRGVEVVDPKGEPFDPGFHEALMEVDAPEGAKAGDVVQVILKGYRREGRPLRAARVAVGRAPAGGDD